MATLSKSKPLYKKVLQHFRKQYKDVLELTILRIDEDNNICGGEWINSKDVVCIAFNFDCVRTIKIID